MGLLLKVIVFCLIFEYIVCPPVKEPKKIEETNEENAVNGDELEDVMEYSRYLKEVVNALESDPTFREKLEKAEEADIRSGKIAHELEFVSHRVRNRLDEIKRSEIERLRHLASMKTELEEETNDVNNHHLDHANPHTFEIDDLKKLIDKTAQDLAEADRRRRADFKEYEMQKKFETEQQLKNASDDEERKKIEENLKANEEKHMKHEQLHHPGSKQQLEEVWEKQDKMDASDFDPKTFFMYHDLDSNNYWDQNEVKMLFVKELDKMYNSGAPEDDMRERAEEMERMREHIFREADLNRDGLISFQEFLDQTRKPEFTRDEGWESLDKQRVYTPEEYREFERRRLEEVQQLIAQGMLPPQPHQPIGHPQMVPGGYPGQGVPQEQYQQQQYHQPPPQQQYYQPPQQQYHQQQPPQQYNPPIQQQQYHQQPPPQQQQYNNLPPQQQQQPPQQQYNNLPPQQQHNNPPPQQHHQPPQQQQPPHQQQQQPQQQQPKTSIENNEIPKEQVQPVLKQEAVAPVAAGSQPKVENGKNVADNKV